MSLANIEYNKSYEIIDISTDNSVLLERFISLGICEGARVELLEKSIDKNTMAIVLSNIRIALRVSEAQEVDVQEVM